MKAESRTLAIRPQPRMKPVECEKKLISLGCYERASSEYSLLVSVVKSAGILAEEVYLEVTDEIEKARLNVEHARQSLYAHIIKHQC
jgi:hypothetical protein